MRREDNDTDEVVPKSKSKILSNDGGLSVLLHFKAMSPRAPRYTDNSIVNAQSLFAPPYHLFTYRESAQLPIRTVNLRGSGFMRYRPMCGSLASLHTVNN